MAYTVEYSFDQFYEAINLGGDHRETANGRKDDIVSKLSKKFEIRDAFATGSIPKYTALAGHADLDVMVVLHWGKHVKDKTPTQVLADVREAVSQWRNGARRNGQAVTLTYSNWPSVDIVPVAAWNNPDGSFSHYIVPNSNNDTWLQSRPKEHAAAIEAKAGKCGHNFRRIIKMVKHWNRFHSEYLQSYHIEVLALNIFNGNMDDTPWNVLQFFDQAKTLLASSLQHDGALVDDYLTWTDRQEVLKRIIAAYDLALAAWHLTYQGNDQHAAAIGRWRVLFGDKFPAYG